MVKPFYVEFLVALVVSFNWDRKTKLTFRLDFLLHEANKVRDGSPNET